MNIYVYVANDPVNGRDRSGEAGEDIFVNGCVSCHKPPLISFNPGSSFTRIQSAIASSYSLIRGSAYVGLKLLTSPVSLNAASNADITDPDSLEGKTPEEVEEAAKEAGFTESRPTNSLGGTALTKPGNKADQIRIMPGVPNRSQEIKRGPYVETSISGKRATVPLAGNPVLGGKK